MSLKAYYDGSGKSDNPNSEYLTLAGYVGTDDAWSAFDLCWEHALKPFQCAYIHMIEAHHLDEEFATSKGWTNQKVEELINYIINNCFAEIAWHEHRSDFRGTSCTVNLVDYRRLRAEFPKFKKLPEAMCVDAVVTVGLGPLPEDSSNVTGKKGLIELYFDRNEKFLHQINGVWQRKRTEGVFGHIASIKSADMRDVPGLQAADVLAWHTNFGYTKQDAFSLMVAQTMGPSHCYYFDYDSMIQRYKPELL